MGASLLCMAELGVGGRDASLAVDDDLVKEGVRGTIGVLAAFCIPGTAGSAAQDYHQSRPGEQLFTKAMIRQAFDNLLLQGMLRPNRGFHACDWLYILSSCKS